jgi:CAAX prenyl protease-like protein
MADPGLSSSSSSREARSSIPYVAPFAVFIGFLSVANWLPNNGWRYGLVLAVMAGVIWWFSRPVLSFRVANPGLTLVVGVGVFAVWIAPDLLFPGYRQHWLFQNSITGSVASTFPAELRSDALVLTLRFLRAAVIIPIAEELFWRAWLMRWVIHPQFWQVALGTYAPLAFWVTAGLFAAEHGPFWEVGLLAGIAYNWLMLRTRSLGDLIAAHAVTNALLSVYVIWSGRWEYWS